jgi:predicted Zn-dependent peptidase
MPAENLYEALSIYADLVRRPHLPADQLEDARQLCLQEVRAVEDDLVQKVMLHLRRQHYADPYGRSCQGTIESLERTEIDDIRGHFEALYGPTWAILSVAGKFEWPRLRDWAGELWGDWRPRDLPPIEESPPGERYTHLPHDSHQTHMGVAYPGAAYSDPDFYQLRGAVGVLSDGMSSRLFREIREKRGLCYSVYAMNHFVHDRGSVVCYAGTTTDRAQETLDLLIAELRRLAEGIEPEELDRLKARIKSALVMQQESSPARSAAIAVDWRYLKRVQTIDELKRIIDNLTSASINEYLAAHPPGDFTIVTLGAKQLEKPVVVPSPNA